MSNEIGIIRPVRTRHTPELGPLAILAASGMDVQLMRSRLNLPDSCALYLSRLYYNATDRLAPALVGPLMGAPYAVMCMETLRSWGARKALFVGWCGSIDAQVHIGDCVVPTAAWIDEGTSLHYGQSTCTSVHPDTTLCTLLQRGLQQHPIDFHSGAVWTTDAIFRETPSRVLKFQRVGALAVEMELSALLSAAAFYDFPLAGLLTVSDELFTFQWRPGFKSEAFERSRRTICDFLTGLLKRLGGEPDNDQR
jgi:purine-nucleoside phosphorylase